MNSREKEKSLLEIAVTLLQRKRKPQKITDIIKEVMSIKGIKPEDIEQYLPQFLLDFMKSGHFIYCGNDCWDLKERQKVSINDKDSDYEELNYGKEVEDNELGKENVDAPTSKNISDIDDPEDDNENEEDSDDLSREFDDLEEDTSNELVEVENDNEEESDEINVEEDEEEEKDEEFDFE